MQTLGFLPNMSPIEMLLIVGLALLLFGRRLPEVGRSLGKGIVEFKKGLAGIDEEVEKQTNAARRTESEYRQPLPPPVQDDRRVSRSDAVDSVRPADAPPQHP